MNPELSPLRGLPTELDREIRRVRRIKSEWKREGKVENKGKVFTQ